MKTRLFSFLFVLIAGVGMVRASDTEVDGIWYDFDDAAMTATITFRGSDYSSYNDRYTGDVTIPESVTYNYETYSVTSIGDHAFFGCTSLTSVTIPNSVTSIGDDAFDSCVDLTSVTIANSVTSIGGRAFSDCSSLTSVTIPNSVTSIEQYAFNNCTGLTSVTIGNSVTSIGYYAFYSCRSLTSISVDEGNTVYDSRDNCNAIIETSTNTLILGCQNTIIPNGVTSIGEQAFGWCSSLTSITIPNSVTSIGQLAFSNCHNLTSITIPNSVTSIGGEAFYYCSGLTSLTIPNSVTSVGNYAFWQCGSLTSIIVESGNSMYDSRENCNAIIETSTNTLIAGCQNTIIPNSVISIGDLAFFGCSLTSVTIPNSVTSIGNNAFGWCSSLTSITIPNSVTSIGDEAFAVCSALTTVTIPNSVTSIGSYAFRDCSSLTSITCEAESAPELGSNVFYNVDKSIPLYVPSGSIAAYQAASGWSEFTNIQAIPGTEGSGTTPMFPGDPGTITYKLQLGAAVIDGDSLPDYTPTGAGGYPQGSEVTVTAQDIPGYQFVQWSDSVTDKSRTVVVNESMTLTALYSHSMIEIAVAANRWTFICLPPLGDRQYTEEMFTYDGLTGVKWGTYSGATRASGKSGWVTPETFNALQGYIIYSTTAGTLRINAYQDEIRQGQSSDSISSPINAYDSNLPENAGWNFLGNPYAQGFDISAFADAGIEAPITVWNGTGYDTYTPGIDTYILQPFEAFFIQKAEGGAETIPFNRE